MGGWRCGRPAGRLTPSERGAINSHLSELLAVLAWNQDATLRSTEDADALVERLEVSRRDPRVQAAAGAGTEIYAPRESMAFTTAIATFRTLVCRLAGVPTKEETEHGPPSDRPRCRETDDPRQATLGLTLREACERAGVHIATACRWQADDPAFGETLTSAAHHAAVERYEYASLFPRLPVRWRNECPTCRAKLVGRTGSAKIVPVGSVLRVPALPRPDVHQHPAEPRPRITPRCGSGSTSPRSTRCEG